MPFDKVLKQNLLGITLGESQLLSNNSVFEFITSVRSIPDWNYRIHFAYNSSYSWFT